MQVAGSNSNNSGSISRKLTQNTVLFSYTGAYQTFTVPDYVTSMTVTATGAGGGVGNSTYVCHQGNGGTATDTFSVTPGDVYYIYVGGQATSWIGGFNGGGNGSAVCGTGGSGATDIRTTVGDLSSRILVAAGGGGCYPCCSNGDGGGGGGRNGLSGSIGCSTGVAGGATQSAGGTAGGSGGNIGTLGYGGSVTSMGAGGGGGYYGGGSANLAGGGGGSSYGPVSATIYTNIAAGNGMLSIAYDPAPTSWPTSQPSSDPTLQPTTAPTVYTPGPTHQRSASNSIYTIAGTGLADNDNSEIATTSVGLNTPRSIWQSTDGVIYFTDYDGCCVRRFSVDDFILNNVAGLCGDCNAATSNVAGTSSLLNNPIGVTGDTLGEVYIGDTSNNYVHKVSTSGILSYYFGIGLGVNAGDGSQATSASIKTPGSLWFFTAGALFVASYDGYKIRSVNKNKLAGSYAG